ncbi:hypothetical protein J5Y03_08545 [Bacillus sp. RG28]|uniref:Aminoglycoside phosphotransferase domain-containing protein n=1 Tax=Gottfriedia endophytica TaxID=2820819 RepID=A0A940SJ93_9BACI|nr:hypothetical protein [Gottfriedia endophytica]MBP0725236.1 hypothetical protein [Gottfriedia endophytica]
MRGNIQEIIQILHNKKLINREYDNFKQFNGTTDSVIGVLLNNEGEPSVIVKTDDSQYINLVENFMNEYQSISLFPKFVYADSDKGFLVYDFQNGSGDFKRENKKKIINQLATKVLSQLKPVSDISQWGNLDTPFSSWFDFQEERITYSRNTIGDILSEKEFKMVMEIVNRLCTTQNYKPYLLHGDCGFHNFLFNESSDLVGVIDPIPTIGPVIHELSFAFCSSPELLNMETIVEAAKILDCAQSLKEEVIVNLYCRIGTCIKHHPADLPMYLEAWKEWKSV